jgi:hypothetical protein
MKQKIVPIITSVGKIWGRDAIYLGRVNVLNESTFELIGKFNGTLCNNLKDETFQKYQITFKRVHLFKMIELDYDEVEYESSFDQIENSEQIAKMIKEDEERHIGKIDSSYKHFVFRTYDTVFEVIGKDYELKLE